MYSKALTRGPVARERISPTGAFRPSEPLVVSLSPLHHLCVQLIFSIVSSSAAFASVSQAARKNNNTAMQGKYKMFVCVFVFC